MKSKQKGDMYGKKDGVLIEEAKVIRRSGLPRLP